MSSPFPGMDPFLEDSAEWGTFHTRLITIIGDQLANIISPHFFVRLEQRVYITDLDALEPARRSIIPDVYVVTTPRSGQAVAEMAGAITEPTLIEPLHDVEIRDRYIEILDTRNREVVTTIEILSPFNKTPGAAGQQTFQHKRQTVMGSQVHWIEIDLLRAGERPPEVRDRSDYYVLLKRGGMPGPFEVWYVDLRDRLPTFAVPLRPPFADVPLDLQQCFEQLYQRAHYADSIDYQRPIPQPPLRPADAAWAKAQIQAWVEKHS